MKRWVIGVDLGGTQIRALRTDLAGEKAARAEQLTLAQQGPQAVVSRILETVRVVMAGNDGNLGALAEHRFGAGIGVDHLVYLTVGTGIGGGIISHGRMLLGKRGFAAEIGHQTPAPGGPPRGV